MSFEITYLESEALRGLDSLAGLERIRLQAAFGWKVRRKLYSMMIPRLRESNGTTPERLLRRFAKRMQRRLFGKGAAQAVELLRAEMLDGGKKFAPAFRPLIPADEYFIIDAGERAGDIATALELLVDLRGRTTKIMAATRKTYLTLAGFLLMLYGTIWAIAKYAIRNLVTFSQAASSTRTASQDFLIAATDWINGSGPAYVGAGLLLATAAVYASLRFLTGPMRLLLERLPPWSTYRAIQGYIWLATYIILVRSGRPETLVLQEQAEKASPWLRERLAAVAELMGQHARLFPAALEECGFNFPSPDIIDDIDDAWGGAEGGYDRLLISSRTWADEIERAALDRAEAVKTGGYLAMFVVSGLIAIAIDTFVPIDV